MYRPVQFPETFTWRTKPTTRYAAVIGAGDVGYAFGVALLARKTEDWRVIFTRRSQTAVAALRDQLLRDGVDILRVALFALDPADVDGVSRFVYAMNCRITLHVLVLASGKAILDSSCASVEESIRANMEANFVSKNRMMTYLMTNGSLRSHAQVIVISSRAMDFSEGSSEMANQIGYRKSISFLETWVLTIRHQSKSVVGLRFHLLRVPLVAGSTADEYKQRGVVPAEVVPVDPRKYAEAELENILEKLSEYYPV